MSQPPVLRDLNESNPIYHLFFGISTSCFDSEIVDYVNWVKQDKW